MLLLNYFRTSPRFIQLEKLFLQRFIIKRNRKAQLNNV